MRLFSIVSLLVGVVVSTTVSLEAADSSGNLTLKSEAQVPGSRLAPGSYIVALEDHLQDRAIVRITSSVGDRHYLVLAVARKDSDLKNGAEFSYFKSRPPALKEWKCSTCASALEFVYPKAEAVSITDGSGQPVLAFDPTYDKLPDNLGADDMKVVTLWLLSPERIQANHTGVGVKAAKYAAGDDDRTTALISSQVPRRNKLPSTASSNGTYALWGFICLLAAMSIRVCRRRAALPR